jgi:hypothetical protein
MTGRLAVVLFVAAAATIGCQSEQGARIDFSDTPRDYVAKDYRGVYTRWTRHEYALHDVDKALEVWATYKSWDFREAYVERYASIYGLPEADRGKLRDAQRIAFEEAFEFHVTAQSSIFKWNDLEKASSPWRLTLVDALGHELQPEVVKVIKLPDAYETEFFPSRTPFTKTYTVRFVAPKGSEFSGTKSGALILRFASPIGRLECTWRA